jgi:hypothetical protein
MVVEGEPSLLELVFQNAYGNIPKISNNLSGIHAFFFSFFTKISIGFPLI